MRIAISSEGAGLEAKPSEVFGRCPYMLLADPETGRLESLANPGARASGGAGVRTARFVVDQGAGVVLARKVGPKAMEVLEAAGIEALETRGSTVGEVLDHFRAGELEPLRASRSRS
jgi:predicted Fe-Mo cluster-binding NifX family protein